jgi:hypothetical protein
MTLALDPILEDHPLTLQDEHTLFGLPPTLESPALVLLPPVSQATGERQERSLGMEMFLLVLLLLGAVLIGATATAVGIALTV